MCPESGRVVANGRGRAGRRRRWRAPRSGRCTGSRRSCCRSIPRANERSPGEGVAAREVASEVLPGGRGDGVLAREEVEDVPTAPAVVGPDERREATLFVSRDSGPSDGPPGRGPFGELPALAVAAAGTNEVRGPHRQQRVAHLASGRHDPEGGRRCRELDRRLGLENAGEQDVADRELAGEGLGVSVPGLRDVNGSLRFSRELAPAAGLAQEGADEPSRS